MRAVHTATFGAYAIRYSQLCVSVSVLFGGYCALCKPSGRPTVRSKNPVLGRLTQRATRHAGLRREPVGGPGYSSPGYPGGYGPNYGAPTTTMDPNYQQQQQQSYSPYAPSSQRAMTVDDVVVRTVALLGLTGLSGAATWLLVPESTGTTGVALAGGIILGLVLGLVIAFMQVTNPLVISAYAVVEGVVLGVVSRFYAEIYGGGIVLQAVVGTFAVFFGMAALYKLRVLRATPKFTRWVTGMLFGFLGLAMLNLLLGAFGVNNGHGLGLRDGGPMAVIFSLVAIGLAALTFINDFGAVEAGVNAGVEQRYAWYCSFGILVGLIWLYLEILRLLGYARN